MNILNATDVRKNWSVTLDSVLHERPAYIKRTRDSVALVNMETMKEILRGYSFEATEYSEDDGSITLSLIDMDIVVNAPDEKEARDRLAVDIKEYAEEYYDNYSIWSVSPNRKKHIPYVLKALIYDISDIEKEIVCHVGKI